MKETFERAKLEILSYVLQFNTLKNYHSIGISGDEKHAVKLCMSENDVKVGDLVIITSVFKATKYYMSWVVEKKKDQTLLRSIEDGSLCWWSNVGFYVLDRSLVNENTRWKWNDRQFDFLDRWRRAFNKADVYLALVYPEFTGDFSVKLTVRKRHSDETKFKNFPDWRKLKSRDMTEFVSSVQFQKQK